MLLARTQCVCERTYAVFEYGPCASIKYILLSYQTVRNNAHTRARAREWANRVAVTRPADGIACSADARVSNSRKAFSAYSSRVKTHRLCKRLSSSSSATIFLFLSKDLLRKTISMLQGYAFFHMNNLKRKFFTYNTSKYFYFIISFLSMIVFIILKLISRPFRFRRRLTLGRDKEDILRMR